MIMLVPPSKYFIPSNDITVGVLDAACKEDLDPIKFIEDAKKGDDFKFTGLICLFQTSCPE